MRATESEFKHRFWIIMAIYFAGFALSGVDRTSFIFWLRRLIAPSISGGTPEAEMFARIAIGAGALLVFLAAAIRTWGAAYLRTDVVHDTSQHSDILVADGPFRYVRNPLYFANLPMATGIGILASRAGFILIVLANWIFVYRLIFREEESLRANQGEPYLRYCRAVPRFWPSLKPRVSAGNLEPQWKQAFAGETFVWLFGVAELAIAFTLNPTIGYILFGLGFVAHFIISSGIQRRKR
ncbi:MAG TPA: isoprenylcysteine carboxylmethyltransferase family protein [Chthoniobacterales bacterium]|nr:isoprenylcysteine carboxylmethyltransferase family protein [Chthoniobacterales bacterium]